MTENKRWQRLLEKLREVQGHPPLNQTDEDLENSECDIPLEPLAKDRISRIVEGVLADSTPRHRRPPLDPSYAPEGTQSSEHTEELLALHRNQGESDPEAEELLRRLREEALDEDDGDAE